LGSLIIVEFSSLFIASCLDKKKHLLCVDSSHVCLLSNVSPYQWMRCVL